MKVLFVGQTWLGSCARSMKEALARHPGIELDELAEDAFTPKVNSKLLRGLNKLVRPLYQREFNQQVVDKIRHNRPDFLVTYKGGFVGADLLRSVSSMGVKTVNIYPDCSPHAHGLAHRQAVGQYDLVISTKPYHPEVWSELYQYKNRCVFVPQGYDPALHLVAEPASSFEFDVILMANCREQYGELMLQFAASLKGADVKVAIGGPNWENIKDRLPSEWTYLGLQSGRSYVNALRKGRICIAPLHREMVIDGGKQPGDVDTTRTYELAAAHCFFVHCRSNYVEELYASAGIPMFDDGQELASQVLMYLKLDDERAKIALAAHTLAVQNHSIEMRAKQIYDILGGVDLGGG